VILGGKRNHNLCAATAALGPPRSSAWVHPALKVAADRLLAAAQHRCAEVRLRPMSHRRRPSAPKRDGAIKVLSRRGQASARLAAANIWTKSNREAEGSLAARRRAPHDLSPRPSCRTCVRIGRTRGTRSHLSHLAGAERTFRSLQLPRDFTVSRRDQASW